MRNAKTRRINSLIEILNINFNNKKFALIQDSSAGTASEQTILHFSQSDRIISARYHGGDIIYGQIIATMSDQMMTMRYHCVTNQNELKAGMAIASISNFSTDKLQLDLNWQWLDGDRETGTSTYLEI